MLLLLGATVLPATAHADADWTGRLRCDVMPGHTDGPLNAPISVHESGRTLSYNRPMGISSGGFTNQAETGTGSLAGDKVDLVGNYAEQGSSEASHYAGKIQAGRMNLNGEQVWTFRRSGDVVHRPCRATLRH